MEVSYLWWGKDCGPTFQHRKPPVTQLSTEYVVGLALRELPLQFRWPSGQLSIAADVRGAQ